MSMPRLPKVFAIVLLALCCPRLAEAADVTLAWDAPTDGVTTGFLIVYGDASHTYTQQIDVGNRTTFTVTGLAHRRVHFFAIRGYDAAGNFSDFSDEVSTDVPTSRRIRSRRAEVQHRAA